MGLIVCINTYNRRALMNDAKCMGLDVHQATICAAVLDSPLPLSLVGAGALAVNIWCAIMLARYRKHSGCLTRPAFLSARNDVLANLAIIAAGITTAFTRSAWPDWVVGLAIALMNADAAKEIYQLAQGGHRVTFP